MDEHTVLGHKLLELLEVELLLRASSTHCDDVALGTSEWSVAEPGAKSARNSLKF